MNNTYLRWVLYRREIFIDKYLPHVKYVHLVRHSLFVMRNDSGCEEFLLNKTAAIPETCSLVMEGCLMVNSPTRTSYFDLKIKFYQLVANGWGVWTTGQLFIYHDPVY